MFSFLRPIKYLLIILLILITRLSFANNPKIAVIVPLEHEAMNQIIVGIKESLKDTDADIFIKNAHSDPNLLLTLIKQIKDQDIDLVMPIGTSASQVTISQIKNKPIIGVAANLENIVNSLITGINDEIPITESLSKMPFINNIAVIYSANEKVMPEIEQLKKYASQHNISLHLSMVQNLVELPSAVRNSPTNIQAFLVLKDHLIVSGMSSLVKEANKRNIPIIASDEGSVIKGATIAIGVREKDIGIKAGIIAKDILNGKKDISHQNLDSFVLFINLNSFGKQKILSRESISALSLAEVEIVGDN